MFQLQFSHQKSTFRILYFGAKIQISVIFSNKKQKNSFPLQVMDENGNVRMR